MGIKQATAKNITLRGIEQATLYYSSNPLLTNKQLFIIITLIKQATLH